MVNWRALFLFGGQDRPRFGEQVNRLLPYSQAEDVESGYPAAEVTKVALKLRYQIEQVVSCELEEWKITKANSPVITRKVVQTAREAGGDKYSACVVYGLLVCHRWFMKQADQELWDADLYNVRAVACEVLAKKLIESEEREDFMMQETLLKRYSTIINGQETAPVNVIERAVDLHALRVIGSSGYQKCIAHLWRGWLVQDEQDPSQFVAYKKKANTEYWAHFDPDRMRAPIYQNAVQIFFSVLFLILYTIAINSINSTGDLDIIEGILYLMTAGFVFDEISKFWKVGRYYIGFWNVFNSTLYALLTVSFVTRMIALGHPVGDAPRRQFNVLSYNFLAFSAPMFWLRLMLYLDNFKFFGTMLVVLKVMMKESVIFFLLLIMVCVGFLQGFIGLHNVEDSTDVTSFIIRSMANSVMQSPDFEGFENFAPPFGLTLYYVFTFCVMVILLNVLIALFNSAYESVTDQSDDEYMALFAAKTLQFIRAPDENVFIAPFNLIEIFCLIIPFEIWMSRDRYQELNSRVMAVVYSPLLLVIAWLETRQADRVIKARERGAEDDDVINEWEQLGVAGEVPDFEQDGWAKAVETTKPNVETDAAVLEIRDLKERLKSLVSMVEKLQSASNGAT